LWASCRWSFSTLICCSGNSATFRRSFCSENTDWTETIWCGCWTTFNEFQRTQNLISLNNTIEFFPMSIFPQKVEPVKTTVYLAVISFFSLFFASARGQEKDFREVLFRL
jgi:hypothetical protein